MSRADDPNVPSATGEIGRRKFVQGSAALGLSTAFVSSFAGQVASAETAPKRGGHLVMALDGASTTDVMDPATLVATFMYTVGYQWGNCLVELAENNTIIPELAESWEPNGTATEWVFKLRKGVEFHNGKEMNADDVIYSINHHRAENSASPAKALLEPITDIRSTGKHEITVTLGAPNADLPYLFADYHMLIMPNQSDPNSAIGTGGYVIEAFEPGMRVIAKRNPNYWKENRAHLDVVETIAINDLTARTSALQAGNVHLINHIDPKTVPLLQRSRNIQIIDVPSAGYYNFPMRCDMAPFDNVDVRLALKYAIDRQDIVDKILRGYGKIGNDHPIGEFDPFYDPDLPQRPYDPEKAKFHFDRSGHGGPVPLYTADGAYPGALDAALLYKEHAARAGITLDVQRVPDDGYWSDVWMKKPFCSCYWAGRPTADMILSMAFHSQAPWNETFWKREDFDKLLLTARGELDIERRRQMYSDLQKMVWDDGGCLLPLFNNFLFAGVENLRGFVPTPVFVGYRVAEQLYFV